MERNSILTLLVNNKTVFVDSTASVYVNIWENRRRAPSSRWIQFRRVSFFLFNMIFVWPYFFFVVLLLTSSIDSLNTKIKKKKKGKLHYHCCFKQRFETSRQLLLGSIYPSLRQRLGSYTFRKKTIGHQHELLFYRRIHFSFSKCLDFSHRTQIKQKPTIDGVSVADANVPLSWARRSNSWAVTALLFFSAPNSCVCFTFERVNYIMPV